MLALPMPPSAGEVFNDPYYFPLREGKFLARSSDLLSIQQDAKARILTNQRDAWTRSLRNTRKKYVNNTNLNSKLVDQLFNGEIFKFLGEEFNRTDNSDNAGVTKNLMMTDLTPAAIKAQADQFDKDLQQISEFTTAFEDFINKTFSDKEIQKVLEQHAQAIIQKLADSEGVDLGTIAGQSKVNQLIVQSFLARDYKVFRIKNDSVDYTKDGVDQWLIRAWTVYNALPNAGDLSGVTMDVHHSGGRASSTATGESEIISAVVDKLRGAIINFKGVSAEGAVLAALQPVVKQLQEITRETQNDLNVDLQSTGGQGGINVQVRVKKDELNKFLQDMTQVEEILKSLGSRGKMKGDVSFIFSGNDILSRLGLSVKDYSSIQFNKTKGVSSVVSGEFDIQGGMSLYTLLNREANLSTSTIINLLKMLAVNDPDYDSNFNKMWEDIKTNALLYGFTNMLTGQLAGLQDTAYYLVLNGRVYTIGTVLNAIVRNLRKDPTGGISMNIAAIEGAGLDRQSYQDLNKKRPPDDDDISAAKFRSDEVRRSTTRLMQDTKVKISVNLLNLAMRHSAILY